MLEGFCVVLLEKCYPEEDGKQVVSPNTEACY